MNAFDLIVVRRAGRNHLIGLLSSIAVVISVANRVGADDYYFVTLAGVAGSAGSTNGAGRAARFNNPQGIAVDSAGNVFVADTGNHVIRMITPEALVTTVAGLAGAPGSADATASDARFFSPAGIAVDGAGNIYVGDSGNHTIRKLARQSGAFPYGVVPPLNVTTLAGLAGVPGMTNGYGSNARFNSPKGVSVDASGNVYVADQMNSAIRMISPAGVVTSLFALPYPGAPITGSYNLPFGVAASPARTVFISDTYHYGIARLLMPEQVRSTLAGFGSPGSSDGMGTNAGFNLPGGIAVDAVTNVFVADTSNQTIRMISRSGMVITLAGSPGAAGALDGLGERARFNNPRGVAVDKNGYIYVADTANHTIRKGHYVRCEAPQDFDGDGRSDIGCYYPPGGNWYVFKSTEGLWQTQFGYSGTVPVSGDFDGDGKADIGCYYAPGGNWYVYRSSLGFWQTQFGYAGTVPVVGDFDGDGRDDFGCYYPPGGNWYIFKSSQGLWMTQFGYDGTIPVVGDFDGDGRDDIGCYHPPTGSWYIFKSSEGFWTTQFGYNGTVPVVGDFDGDGRDDFGCYYPPGGNWYIFKSSQGLWMTQFGYSGTVPVVGDFDGDCIADIGCYFAPGGNWYVYRSSLGFWQTQFGYDGTVPVSGVITITVTPPPPPPPPANCIASKWAGSWSGNYNYSGYTEGGACSVSAGGTMTMTLATNGCSDVTGTVILDNIPTIETTTCTLNSYDSQTGSVTANVTSNTISGTFNAGGLTFNFSGTKSGTTLNGSMNTPYKNGSFTLSR